jgi:hypothetical protein
VVFPLVTSLPHPLNHVRHQGAIAVHAWPLNRLLYANSIAMVRRSYACSGFEGCADCRSTSFETVECTYGPNTPYGYFHVPPSVSMIHVDAIGANGGCTWFPGGCGAGGTGAEVSADLKVAPGNTLYASPADRAGASVLELCDPIFSDPPCQNTGNPRTDTRWLVAAAGGDPGYTGGGGNGGNADVNGTSAGGSGSGCAGSTGGGGASESSPGSGGTGPGGAGSPGTPGSGGNGASWGGPGGAGFLGGGGGGEGPIQSDGAACGAGGGAGSSYVKPGVYRNVHFLSNPSNGPEIVISWDVCGGSGETITCTFPETDAEQEFVVPAGVSSVHAEAVGACGGGGFCAGGAVVNAVLPVSPGEHLYLEVGGSNGWNGGGSGNTPGGGASDIRTCSKNDVHCLLTGVPSTDPRLIVAGGGGGAGGFDVGGGSAGTLGSGAGISGQDCVSGDRTGGLGGTDTTAGAGGSGIQGGLTGTAGSSGVGGNGQGYAAGGGGGFFGGGGGGQDDSADGGGCGGGGGGGSTYVTARASSVKIASADFDNDVSPPLVRFTYKVTPSCPAEVTSNGDPRFVVVLASGIDSALNWKYPAKWNAPGAGHGGTGSPRPDFTYSPLKQAICPDDPMSPLNGDEPPPGIDSEHGTTHPGPGAGLVHAFSSDWPEGNTDLVQVIASHGGVVLPFSYVRNGVQISGKAADAVVSILGYGPWDVGGTVPGSQTGIDYRSTAAYFMEKELESIHAAWPSSRIVVVGHSEGGLVAERWWQDYHGTTNGLGVSNVFSLDSPINGLSLNPCRIPIASFVGGLCGQFHMQDNLAKYWDELWVVRLKNDQVIVKQDFSSSTPKAVYSALGTRKDAVYVDGDDPYDALGIQKGNHWNPLLSQMVFVDGCALSETSSWNCNVHAPNVVSACDEKSGGWLNINEIIRSHGQVINCNTNDSIVESILDSATSRTSPSER